jgi:hypothetical protein
VKGGRREEGGSWGCACGGVWGRGGAGACCPSGRVGGSSFFFLFGCDVITVFPGRSHTPLAPSSSPARPPRAPRPGGPPSHHPASHAWASQATGARARGREACPLAWRATKATHTPPHTQKTPDVCPPLPPFLPPPPPPVPHALLPPTPTHRQSQRQGGPSCWGRTRWTRATTGRTCGTTKHRKKSWGLYAGECREGATRARQACHRPPARPGTWGYRWATPWPWKLGVAGALMAAARRRGGSRLFLDTPAPVCRVPACGLPRALSLCILTFFPLPPPSPGRATSGPRRPAPADGCPRRWWWRHGRGGELVAGVWPSDWEGAETLRVGGDAHTPLCLRPRPPGRRRRRRRRQ